MDPSPLAAFVSLASSPPPIVYEQILPVAAGCFAFGSTLAMSTCVQNSMLLGVSTATRIWPTALGVLTVSLASIASNHAAVVCHAEGIKRFGTVGSKLSRKFQSWNPLNLDHDEHIELLQGRVKIPLHGFRVAAIGTLAFMALGGRFWAISPSSFTHKGSFARWSIPCTEKYATTQQRTMIERMGRKWGCHTCGSRMFFTNSLTSKHKFVGDHMPPKSIAEALNQTWLRRRILGDVQYRFYPQCVNCSNTQGSILSKASKEFSSTILPSFRRRAAEMKRAGGGSFAHNHAFRPRINHLAGGVVAGATVFQATHDDIFRGNEKRFREWQNRIEDGIYRLIGER